MASPSKNVVVVATATAGLGAVYIWWASRVKKEYTFDHVSKEAFDSGGVLYALGTSFGLRKYRNPFEAGAVGVSFSDDAANFYSRSTGHRSGDHEKAATIVTAQLHPGGGATMYSNGASNAWFQVDLGIFRLAVTHYCYRGDYGGGNNQPRTFELQGSNDGKDWITLRQHKADAMVTDQKAGSWDVEAAPRAFRMLRIRNQGAPKHLCCGGIEFYGTLQGSVSLWMSRQLLKTLFQAASWLLWAITPPLVPAILGTGARAASTLASSLASSPAAGDWQCYSNIDMCGQGDVECIPDWRSKMSIEDLKRIVEEKKYSAFTIGDFGHAALKNFDYQLTKEHCKPASGYSCEIYILSRPREAKEAKAAEEPKASPAVPAEPEAPLLSLVEAGSAGQLVFEHAAELAKGGVVVPLTLKSPAGKAIVSQQAEETVFDKYHIFACAVGSADLAVRVRQDDGFLAREDNGYVFDVDKWKFEVGNRMWMLREHDDASSEDTRRTGGGRTFKVNLPEGTISPLNAPHLVFGVSAPKLVLVPKGSPKRCIFEQAQKLKKGEFVPLKLASPGAGTLGIVPLTEEVKVIFEFIEYIQLRIGASSNAIRAAFQDSKYIARETIVHTRTMQSKPHGMLGISGHDVRPPVKQEYSMVFDIAFGKMETGNEVNMLQHKGEQRGGTRDPNNKARHFQINDDGSISPAACLDLCLGVEHI